MEHKGLCKQCDANLEHMFAPFGFSPDYFTYYNGSLKYKLFGKNVINS